MRYFGIIGQRLSHSFSPGYFEDFFRRAGIEACYLTFEGETLHEVMRKVLSQPGLEGFNVTIPFKREVLQYCTEAAEEVAAIGAANCIVIQGGRLKAHNTDAEGFRHLLSMVPAHRRVSGALVLGTGGAASAVCHVLEQFRIPFLSVSRTPSGKQQIDYGSITPEVLRHHPLIVNTTPLGMHPDTAHCPPLPYHLLSGEEILIDLIYNPEKTMFMKRGDAQGCFTLNGLPMLYRQADRSWEIWNETERKSNPANRVP